MTSTDTHATDTLTGNLIEPDTSDTYLDRKIPCVDCYDGDPATLEATVSIGELDGLVLGVHIPSRKTYESIELDLEQARNLREVLDVAIPMLEAAE